MPQEGTFVQLNATGAATSPAMVAAVQQLQVYAKTFKSQLDVVLGEFNNQISGGSVTNLETLLGLITGQSNGQNLFNIVNGSSQAMNGTGQNSQIVNLVEQVGGP
jgi:hypothetical protein